MSEAFERVSSLHRLLHEAVEHGVERDILIAFAEALIAWDAIELRAYVEDVHGRLTLSVATPGTDRLQPSSFVDRELLQSASGLTPLPFAEAARFGFPRDKDVMIARLGSEHSQPWLLMFSGALTKRDEARLSLYVDLLREAIARVATIAETRTSWAILQRLLASTESPEETGRAALGELTQAVDGVGSALVVTAPNGVRPQHERRREPAALQPPPGYDQLVATLPILDTHTMVLAAYRAHGMRSPAASSRWWTVPPRRLPRGCRVS